MKGTLRLCCVTDHKNTNFVSPRRDCERMPSGHPPRNTSKDETMAFSSHSAWLLAHYHQNETLFLFVMRRWWTWDCCCDCRNACVIDGTSLALSGGKFSGFSGRENRWNISLTDTVMRKPLFVQQFNLFSRQGSSPAPLFLALVNIPQLLDFNYDFGRSFRLLMFVDICELKMNELSSVQEWMGLNYEWQVGKMEGGKVKVGKLWLVEESKWILGFFLKQVKTINDCPLKIVWPLSFHSRVFFKFFFSTGIFVWKSRKILA